MWSRVLVEVLMPVSVTVDANRRQDTHSDMTTMKFLRLRVWVLLRLQTLIRVMFIAHQHPQQSNTESTTPSSPVSKKTTFKKAVRKSVATTDSNTTSNEEKKVENEEVEMKIMQVDPVSRLRQRDNTNI